MCHVRCRHLRAALARAHTLLAYLTWKAEQGHSATTTEHINSPSSTRAVVAESTLMHRGISVASCDWLDRRVVLEGARLTQGFMDEPSSIADIDR
jgi:hypothetical protein